MTVFHHTIVGGDFERAGHATDALKDLLKTVGVDPESTRRAAIAAYEAELNVIIHARRGILRATIGDERLDIEIEDEGPGVADVALALQPGFSTASQQARSLGFGAGLGLPNIKRNSDTFSLESTVGVGCRLRFGLSFSCVEPLPPAPNALRFVSERCRLCLRCLPVCPTQALRVRGTGPSLLAHRCVDCNACIAHCIHGAIQIDNDSPCPDAGSLDVLVLPLAFLTDFGPNVSYRLIREIILQLGFSRLALLEQWEAAQQNVIDELLAQNNHPLPIIDVACPVVTRLIETRFPSLLPHLAPLLSPLEAAAAQLQGQKAAFVVACPAQQTSLRQAGVPSQRILTPRALRQAIDQRLRAKRPTDQDSDCPPIRAAVERNELVASGLTSTLRVLEAIEGERLEFTQRVMLRACVDGCFGSPLFRTPSALALHRSRRMTINDDATYCVARRQSPYQPRPALRLDSDMQASVKKLHRMAEALRSLPQADCGRCGAPSCRSHAEDYALGRIRSLQCKHPSARSQS